MCVQTATRSAGNSGQPIRVTIHPRVDISPTHRATRVFDISVPVKFEAIIFKVEPERSVGMVSYANRPVIVYGSVWKCRSELVVTSTRGAVLPPSLVVLSEMISALGVPSMVARTVYARVAEHNIGVFVVTNELVAAFCPREWSLSRATKTTLGYCLVVVLWRATEELVERPVVSLAGS